MDLMEAIRNRRSIRHFLPREVAREDLLTILDAGRWAPASCNKQLWRFIVVDRAQLHGPLAKACAPIRTMDPPHAIIIAYANDFDPVHWAGIQSAAAAAQNMLLRAHEMGIATCWMAGYGDEAEIKRLLNIPEEFDVLSAVSIGYAAETEPPPLRRSLDEVVFFGSMDGKSMFPGSWQPKHWTMAGIREWVNYTIRAKSPFPKYYAPKYPTEFRAENEHLPKLDGRVLYFYPFAGNYYARLAETGRLRDCRLVGFTVGEEIARFVRAKQKNLNLGVPLSFAVSLKGLPFRDGSFDSIISHHRLGRFPDPGLWARELVRVLRPGGTLHLYESNAASPYWLTWRLTRPMRMGFGKIDIRGPWRPVTPGELGRWFRGLELVSRTGFSPLARDPFEGKRLPWPLSNLCKTLYHRYRKPGGSPEARR